LLIFPESSKSKHFVIIVGAGLFTGWMHFLSRKHRLQSIQGCILTCLYLYCTGAANHFEAESSVDVGSIPAMIKTSIGSDWDSGSFSSSGQSPLNGTGRYMSNILLYRPGDVLYQSLIFMTYFFSLSLQYRV